MGLTYIEKIKNEVKEKYSENNIYYKYLDNIEYYQKQEICINCNKKGFHMHEGREVMCSLCGEIITYLDEIVTTVDVMNYSLSRYNKHQKELIEKEILNMEYDDVISFLLDIMNLPKVKLKTLFGKEFMD